MAVLDPGVFAVPGDAWPGAVWPGNPLGGTGPSLLQQASGSATSDYGIGTTAITTQPGSFLVAFAGWNCVTSGARVQVPAVSVTDSAGNLWQQAAITVAGTSPTRCAVWVCPNALPVTWVSVGLTGFAASAAWVIAEVAGMPQAAGLDFAVGTSSSGTAPSLSWIASGSDIGFAVVAAGNASETVASGPAGWAPLATPSAGSATTGTIIFPYWNAGISAGTAATALTLGTSASYSYALCAVSASASPPPQPSLNFPLVQVEAAFGAQPGNISASTDYLFSSEYISWTDITARAIGPAVQGRIKVKRGRQYQLQQEEAGTAEIPLSNVDGAFTPTSPGSPFYSNAINANMSFQAGIAPWSAQNGAVIAQSPAFAYASGLNATAVYSLQVTPNGVSGDPGAQAERVPVNPNYPYTMSAWYNCPAGWATGAKSKIDWYNAAGMFITTTFGTAVPLAAGVWTQATVPAAVPPAGARFAVPRVALFGTAPTVFYVAEAALVTGSLPVQTGLVTPVTPVRVTAWWQGRRYPVWSGYAQQWPQEWPDMPQWGFSTLKAADALAVAGAGQMQSALIGEVLIDNPYAYLPCNESYTTQINGATPANPFIVNGGFLQPTDANGLAAVNRANGNQITGTYLDGSGTTATVSTGLAMNFLGDNGTGMGATGYSGQVNGQRGPSVLYADPGLPAIASSPAGFTIEFWFTWGGTSSQNLTLLSVYGNPSAFFAPGSTPNGSAIVVAITSGNAFQVTYQGSTFSGATAVTPSAAPQHCVMTIGSGFLFAYVNGQQQIGTPIGGPATQMNAIVLGPGRYSYDCDNGLFSGLYTAVNYSAGHLAIYGYQLPQSRIIAHYQTGAAGQSGVGAGTRFGQILTWAQLGLRRGGYSAASATGTPEITRIGPAYQLSGQPANSAVYALAQSEGGDYGTQANGSLIYLERRAGYNQPVSAVLSDGTAAAPVILNTDPGFATGLAGWTASAGGTVSYSPGNRYGSLGSLLLTPSGSGTITSPAFTYNGGSANAGFWVNCAAGGTVTCGAVTAAGTSSAAAAVSAGAWSFVPVTIPAGTGVTSAVLSASAGATPFYLAYAAMWYSPGSVPYLPKSSYGFDNTYIYNEVTATQQNGPNQLVLYDARGTVSQAQYFRRSALTFSLNVVSPYDVSDVTTWALNEYQQPSMHVSAVTVDAASNPLQAFPAILALDENQIAQVNRNPVGGAALAETGIVELVQHDIGAGYWRAGYQLSPYGPAQAVLCADTAGFSAPGTTPSLVLSW